MSLSVSCIYKSHFLPRATSFRITPRRKISNSTFRFLALSVIRGNLLTDDGRHKSVKNAKEKFATQHRLHLSLQPEKAFRMNSVDVRQWLTPVAGSSSGFEMPGSMLTTIPNPSSRLKMQVATLGTAPAHEVCTP